MKNIVSGDSVPPKFAPKKTSKSDAHKAISSALEDLKEQSKSLQSLIVSLEATMRGDVSVSTVEETKLVLSGMETSRKHVVVLRDTLKGRVRTRINEI